MQKAFRGWNAISASALMPTTTATGISRILIAASHASTGPLVVSNLP